ncbi:hypothetical protein HFN71_28455 [Rhizobium laguerreae]|uniref:hypothetical protein n=1 Tax=Rhizobium laguerreae TaxID=1076926 RepID=UPI001C9110C9|nr:hypothetical protein [Rhizobium laguerreae]MBY3543619.1 hypothetical protein [Rhizobium laguerreae]
MMLKIEVYMIRNNIGGGEKHDLHVPTMPKIGDFMASAKRDFYGFVTCVNFHEDEDLQLHISVGLK